MGGGVCPLLTLWRVLCSPGLLLSGTGDHRDRMSELRVPSEIIRETETQREDMTAQGHVAGEKQSQAEHVSLLGSGPAIALNCLKLP